jgi:hypothetical protein
MSRKLSLSTAALCAAVLALPLLAPPSHAKPAKEPKKSYGATQEQPNISPMNEVVFYPFIGDAAIMQNGASPSQAPK